MNKIQITKHKSSERWCYFILLKFFSALSFFFYILFHLCSFVCLCCTLNICVCVSRFFSRFESFAVCSMCNLSYFIIWFVYKLCCCWCVIFFSGYSSSSLFFLLLLFRSSYFIFCFVISKKAKVLFVSFTHSPASFSLMNYLSFSSFCFEKVFFCAV